MSDWIRFHRELCEGAKRGVSRASRFVYMELSRLSRPKRGVMPLTPGMSDVDAVHDAIGGNRKEIAEALRLLVAVLPGEDEAMVRLEDRAGARVLIVLPCHEKQRPKIPPALRRVVIARDGLMCGLCGVPVSVDEIDIDHIEPLSLGGPTTLENLRVTHASCNRSRGNKAA